MIFEAHIPNAPLSRFVQSFIYFSEFLTPHLIERFLPDGNLELIISLDDEPEHVYHNESLREIQACRKGWASGLRTRPISIPGGSGTTKLIVIFRAGMAHPFFPMPMSEISDAVVDADILWGNSFEILRERILEESDIRRRFEVTEDFLTAMLGSDTELNPCVEFAVRGIGSDPSGTRLAKLSDRIGYSQKHLISMFKKKVGTTPKTYLRVMRFQKAVAEIESRTEYDWAEIALDAGFYDQAHFINDFRELSGFTPGEYVTKKTDTLNYVPVA